MPFITAVRGGRDGSVFLVYWVLLGLIGLYCFPLRDPRGKTILGWIWCDLVLFGTTWLDGLELGLWVIGDGRRGVKVSCSEQRAEGS